MGYINPLLELPAMQTLLDLPDDCRAPLTALLRDLSKDANHRAEVAWKRRKGPMASYWRSVATYARHTAHALSSGDGAKKQARRGRRGEHALLDLQADA